MDKIQELKRLVESLSVDATKVFEKNNVSAGIRARKTLLRIEELIVPARREVLTKMKCIPKRNKKNDNLIR